MSQTFHCPNCGAPLDYDPSFDPVIQCPYCHSGVIVPEEWRSATPGAPTLAAESLAASITPDLSITLAEIRRLAHTSKKIEAVKLYHQTFDTGLKAANDAIDQLVSGHAIAFSIESFQKTGVLSAPISTSAGTSARLPAASFQQIYVQVDNKPAQRKPGDLPSWGTILIALLIFGSILVPLIFVLFGSNGPLESLGARLNLFAPARLALEFGKRGSGAGFFDDPRAIAIAPNGDVFVAEYSDGRISKFNSRGEFQFLWNIGPEQYVDSVVIDRAGNVSLVYRGKLWKYDGGDGALLSSISHPDERWFGALAAGADGSLVAAVNSLDLMRYDSRGAPEPILFGAPEGAEGVEDIALDGVGNIYLLTDNEAVVKLDPDGRLLARFGSSGDEEGQFRAPAELAVDGQGRIYVSDFKGIQIFENDGRYAGLLNIPGFAFDMDFDPQGDLWVVTNTPRVLMYRMR